MRRRVPVAMLCLCVALAGAASGSRCVGQTPAAPPAPSSAPTGAPPSAPGTAGGDAGAGAFPIERQLGESEPGGPAAPGDALPANITEVTAEESDINGSIVHARNVLLRSGEYTLSGGWLDGDFEREVVLTGNPTVTFRSQTLTGDAIHYEPKTRLFRVTNLHTALTSEFLQGRLLAPLYLDAGDLRGRAGGDLTATSADATTCERPRPHYLLQARELALEPGRRLVLRNASFILWGRKLITLPTLVVPLRRPRAGFRTNYLPHFGRSEDEGWFAKSAFDYLLSRKAPGLLRVDAMEKKGIGLGIDQRYALARLIGGLAIYAIPTGPSNRNLSGRIDSQLRLGGSQSVTLLADFQKNSYLALPETTSSNARIGYSLSTPSVGTNMNVGRTATTSAGYSTASYTAALAQTLRIGSRWDMSAGSDYSTNSTSSTSASSTFSQRTERLTARGEMNYRASNYALQLTANRNVPIGAGVGQSYFSGVEKLPEITLSNYRFTQGFLSRVPALLSVSAGKYSEGSGAAGTGQVVTERVIAGFDLENGRIALTRGTELSVSGGFQQYLYGDGAAQYAVRTHATLTQRMYKASGVTLDYGYQRPQGGTPFQFDQQGQYHTLTGDIGLLGDRRLQLTARVGYDFVDPNAGGLRQPWQTFSANLLARPTDWSRLQNLVSFDPNTGRVVSVTTDLRFRGRSEFALDLVSRYDPARHAIGNLNGYLNLPIGRAWRVVALLRYNGYLSQFESRNLQIVRDLHCMEASFTYSENPFGFRNDRQVFFQLRIKAFPVFQRFGVGQFGQALDTSVGGGAF